jgi:Zn-dependent protease with chaperone function
MWLVMIGLGIVWALVSIFLALVTIPIVAITVILGAVIAAIPVLLLTGLFSLFLGGPLPWIVAILFVLPLFFTLAFSPWILLGAWQVTFTSSVWTLTYRELKAVPDATPKVEPAAS